MAYLLRLCKLRLLIDLGVNTLKHSQNPSKKSHILFEHLRFYSKSRAYLTPHEVFHGSAGFHLFPSKKTLIITVHPRHRFFFFLSALVIYFTLQRWNSSCIEVNGKILIAFINNPLSHQNKSNPSLMSRTWGRKQMECTAKPLWNKICVFL